MGVAAKDSTVTDRYLVVATYHYIDTVCRYLSKSGNAAGHRS